MKKNLKINSLILLVMLLSGKLNAQSNYQQANIVTVDGTIIQGFIDYKEWDRNPSMFKFKTSMEATERPYYPKEISSFEIHDKDHFESHLVNISQERVSSPEYIEKGTDTASKREVVLLRLISKGNHVNLYTYTDNIKTRYYIATTDKEPVELMYKRYFNNEGRLITEDIFKAQFFALAKKNKDVKEKVLLPLIQEARYTMPSIVKIVNCINGAESRIFVSRSKKKIEFYIGAYLQAAAAKYHGMNELSDGAESKISLLPGLSAGVNLYVNPYVRKVWLRFDGSFAPAKYKITKAMDNQSGYITHTFSQYSFGFTPQVIYNVYNSSGFRFNVGTGVKVTYSAYANNVYEAKYTTNPGLGGSYNYTDKIKLEPLGFSIPIRVGILAGNRFDIYAQYNIPITATASYVFYNIKINSGQLGVNIMF